MKNWHTYLYAFGACEDVYTKENIYMSSEERNTDNLHNEYEKHKSDISFELVEHTEEEKLHKESLLVNAETRTRKKTQYDYWASLARALHLRYKVFSAGYITASVFNCASAEERKASEQAALREYKSFVCSDKHSQEDEKKVNMLSWLEHRRWCAYTRVCGFTCPTDYTLYSGYTKSHKEMKLKLHPCLVEASVQWRNEAERKDSLDIFCDSMKDDYKQYDHPSDIFKDFKEID